MKDCEIVEMLAVLSATETITHLVDCMDYSVLDAVHQVRRVSQTAGVTP